MVMSHQHRQAHPGHQVGPQHPPPAGRWNSPIGVQQRGQPAEHDRRCPQQVQQHRGPAERQRAVPETVDERRVGARAVAGTSTTAKPSRIHPTGLRGWRRATTRPTPPKGRTMGRLAPTLEPVKLWVTAASSSTARKSATPKMARTFAVAGDARRNRPLVTSAATGPPGVHPLHPLVAHQPTKAAIRQRYGADVELLHLGQGVLGHCASRTCGRWPSPAGFCRASSASSRRAMWLTMRSLAGCSDGSTSSPGSLRSQSVRAADLSGASGRHDGLVRRRSKNCAAGHCTQSGIVRMFLQPAGDWGAPPRLLITARYSSCLVITWSELDLGWPAGVDTPASGHGESVSWLGMPGR